MPVRMLMILTSHDRLGESGRATGFWLEEFAAPYYLFVDSGLEVTLASPKGGQPPVDPRSEADAAMTEATRRFLSDAVAQRRLAASVPLDEIDPAAFDAVFYPGGHGALFDLVDDPHSIRLIEAFSATGKPMAAISHGPIALLNAVRGDGRPVVEGRRLTGATNEEEEARDSADLVPLRVETALTDRGARFGKGRAFTAHAIADGLIVTGQNPMSSNAAAAEMMRLIRRRQAA